MPHRVTTLVALCRTGSERREPGSRRAAAGQSPGWDGISRVILAVTG
jgi:hypothetical protein